MNHSTITSTLSQVHVLDGDMSSPRVTTHNEPPTTLCGGRSVLVIPCELFQESLDIRSSWSPAISTWRRRFLNTLGVICDESNNDDTDLQTESHSPSAKHDDLELNDSVKSAWGTDYENQDYIMAFFTASLLLSLTLFAHVTTSRLARAQLQEEQQVDELVVRLRQMSTNNFEFRLGIQQKLPQWITPVRTNHAYEQVRQRPWLGRGYDTP